MRQIFSILAFILLSASVFAQSPNTPPILFSSRFQITNAVNGTGDTIVISGYTDDCTTRFSNSDIAIGDSLYVLEGTDLLIFGVVTTRTISLGIATFKVRDFNGAGLLPSNGQAAIFRPTTDYDFPGYVCGLNDGLQQYISDRFRQNLDAALAAGSTDSTIYATVYSRDTAAAAIRGEIAALAQPPFDSSDIATGGIGNTDLAADIVTASKIAADAVGSSEIAANAVGNSEMADNAIGSAEIIAESIQAADIDTGAVTTLEILDATVAWVDLAQPVKDSINAGGADSTIFATDYELDTLSGNLNDSLFAHRTEIDTLSDISIPGLDFLQNSSLEFPYGTWSYYNPAGTGSIIVITPISDTAAIYYTLYSNYSPDKFFCLRDMEICNISVHWEEIRREDVTYLSGTQTGTGATQWADTLTTTIAVLNVPEGGGIQFHHWSDNRGAIWKFKLNGSSTDTVVVDTYDAIFAADVDTAQLWTGLDVGEYVVTGEVVEYRNPSSTDWRGWISNLNNTSSSNTAPFCSTSSNKVPYRISQQYEVIELSSIKEFGFQGYPTDSTLIGSDAKWMVAHGDAACKYRSGGDSIIIYQGANRLTIPSGGAVTPIVKGDVKIIQDLQTFHTSNSFRPTANLKTTHSINGTIEFNATMQFLRPFRLGTGYTAMLPFPNSNTDTLVSNSGEKIVTNISDGSNEYFRNTKHSTSFFSKSTLFPYQGVCTLTNSSFATGNSKKSKLQNISFVQHRGDAIQKLYILPIEAEDFTIGEYIFLNHKYGITR